MAKNYKQKYIKYKAKYLDLKNNMDSKKKIKKIDQEGAFGFSKLDKIVYTQMNDDWNMKGGAERKAIDMDKEVMKLVPEINEDFVNLYFSIRMGLHHYKAKKSDGEATLTGREVAEALVELATLQLDNKLKKDNKILKNVVTGINYGKKSGKDETVENLLDYTKTFDKMYKKNKKEKGKDYNVKEFKKHIIKLIIKLHEAENEIVEKYQK